MTANGNQIRSLYEGLKEIVETRKAGTVQPLLYGQQITEESADVTVHSTITPLWCETQDPEAKRGVWYCLAVHNVSVTLPEGFTAQGSDTAGSKIFLGKIRIELSHDDTAQPLTISSPGKDKAETLRVSCEHAGPAATKVGGNVSNTVSEVVGANVGGFGEILQGGVSYSKDFSNTVSKTLTDVEITTDIVHHRSLAWWEFDYNQIKESPASRSDFDYSVQTIWRFMPVGDLASDITTMPFNIKVIWTPHGYWLAGNAKISEGECNQLETSCSLRLINDETHKVIPGSHTKIEAPPPST